VSRPLPSDQQSRQGFGGDIGSSSGRSSARSGRSRLNPPIGNTAAQTATTSASKERCTESGQTRASLGSISASRRPARYICFSQTAIAEYVGIGHATVSRWLRHDSFPEQQPRSRSARVDPHLPQLIEHWETGSYTVAQLHRELVANGYPHSYDSVSAACPHPSSKTEETVSSHPFTRREGAF